MGAGRPRNGRGPGCGPSRPPGPWALGPEARPRRARVWGREVRGHRRCPCGQVRTPGGGLGGPGLRPPCLPAPRPGRARPWTPHVVPPWSRSPRSRASCLPSGARPEFTPSAPSPCKVFPSVWMIVGWRRSRFCPCSVESGLLVWSRASKRRFYCFPV